MNSAFVSYIQIIGLSLALFTPSARAEAPAKEWKSGPYQVHLIELYTSEGCSSCPPADRFLSQLRKHEGLWKNFVPLSFHVDYWNDLGWKDPFSKPEYTQRQRNLARSWGNSTIYTPGFVRNGEEWKGWRSQKLQISNKEIGTLRATQIGDGTFRVQFSPIQKGNEYTVHAALLDQPKPVDVQAGENRGRTLQHDFVVTDLVSKPMKPFENGFQSTIQLNNSNRSKSLAVWISKNGSLSPIQAVGGDL